MIGMGGVSVQGAVSRDVAGRVLMPDGKTPAAFARVFYFSADEDSPAGDGLTDAKGTIQTHGLWRTNPCRICPAAQHGGYAAGSQRRRGGRPIAIGERAACHHAAQANVCSRKSDGNRKVARAFERRA